MPTGKIKMFNEDRGFGFIKYHRAAASLSSNLVTPEQVDALKLRAGDVRELVF
jgi:'Cold-shock' DNA-binding domain